MLLLAYRPAFHDLFDLLKCYTIGISPVEPHPDREIAAQRYRVHPLALTSMAETPEQIALLLCPHPWIASIPPLGSPTARQHQSLFLKLLQQAVVDMQPLCLD